ncbi:hypothetical protein BJV77DRAFT_317431 [Russula vinacea]|nr:hypothetical protein BJV77DRAFT_317431 [Russula vinacea]
MRISSSSYNHHRAYPDATRVLVILLARWSRSNRLLKNSGTRNRRNPLASAEDRTPATHTRRARWAMKTTARPLWRRRQCTDALPLDFDTESLSRCAARRYDVSLVFFKVPTSLLPATMHPTGYINRDAQGLERKQEPRAMIPAVCAVNGCTAKRMYRLVRDWEHEACHILERWYYGPGPVVVSAIHLWGL